MLFGKKKESADNVLITTSSAMSLEDLYEAIKNVEFEAGTPKLYKSVIAFEPYLTFDYKIVIEGSDGEFHCTFSTRALDAADAAFSVLDGAIDLALGINKKLDRHLGDSDQEKYGNLNNAIKVLCADTSSKIIALGL